MRKSHDTGFTLVEVSIILLVLVILGTVMLPQLGNYNRLARFTKAREDLGALCSVAKAMLDGVWLGAFYDDPGGDSWDVPPTMPVGMLAGPGPAPIEGSVSNSTAALGIDAGEGWYATNFLVYPCVEATPDVGGAGMVEFSCDELQFHIQANSPHMTYPYPNPLDDPRPLGVDERDVLTTFFGWRGPYVDELTTDPWGTRYMVNSFALYASEGTFVSPVICYSAGPDGGADTPFNFPAGTPYEIGGDDLAVVLSAGGAF